MGKLIRALKKKEDLLVGKSVSKEDIYDAEQVLNVNFAKEYIEYLEEFGFACYDGHELTGICKAKRLNVVEVTIKERNYVKSLPEGAYVIEEAHIDGIVIWQVKSGEIYQTHGNGSITRLCDSLYEYVNM